MAIVQATLTYSEYACNSILVQGVRESLKDIDPSTHALAAAHWSLLEFPADLSHM